MKTDRLFLTETSLPDHVRFKRRAEQISCLLHKQIEASGYPEARGSDAFVSLESQTVKSHEDNPLRDYFERISSNHIVVSSAIRHENILTIVYSYQLYNG